MKKFILLSTIVATIVVNSQSAYADSSTEDNIGFASGAITGGLVAGPFGFIVGAVIGAVIGDGIESKNELKQANTKLAELSIQERDLKDELWALQSENDYKSEVEKNNQIHWMTEGLTLNLMFTSGSSNLSDNDILNIQQVSKVLSQFPDLNIKLDGYTDPVGTENDNILLSQNRINSVMLAFNHYGIASNRLISNAHGEAEGYKIEDGQDALAMARKVSINFVSQSENDFAQN